MTFVDLSAGESVFVDANTFVYHFQPHPTWGAARNQFMTRLEQSQIQVVAITAPLMARTAVLCQQFDLLTNDALIVAVMQHHGLTNLASHDADFDRVPGLTRYAPA